MGAELAASKIRLRMVNRFIWIGVFVCVTAALAWFEWNTGSGSAVGWFLATSFWSALCGIGFTVSDWLFGSRGGEPGKEK